MAAFYGRDSDAAWIEECGDTDEEWDACTRCGGLGDGVEEQVGRCAACGGTGSETARQRLRWLAWLAGSGDGAHQG